MTLDEATARSWLAVAVEEARAGLAEGGIPIGAALSGADGTVLGRGHNRRVQDADPSMHGETSAFGNAGRQSTYPRDDDGHDALAVLVLQRAGAAVRHLAGGDRRGRGSFRLDPAGGGAGRYRPKP